MTDTPTLTQTVRRDPVVLVLTALVLAGALAALALGLAAAVFFPLLVAMLALLGCALLAVGMRVRGIIVLAAAAACAFFDAGALWTVLVLAYVLLAAGLGLRVRSLDDA